jgi:uncharacterized DUF497 family protein
MPGFPDELAACTGFEWDAGNATKSLESHQVTQAETEQAFFNRPVRIAPGRSGTHAEGRYALLGQTYESRLLTVIFTVRGTLVRPISSRDMSRQERRLYARLIQESS